LCLLKKFTEEDLYFIPIIIQRKAIEANPQICLSFFWHSMERQVIIKGLPKGHQKLFQIIMDSRPEGVS
jgi:pyridoxamine 5'-phosphate oxidase